MHKSLQTLTLSLINVGHILLDHRWNFDNIISPFNRLYYIEEGEGRVYCPNRVLHLKPGYLYLIPSFTYSRYHCEHYMSQYYLSFFDKLAEGLSIYHLKSFRYEVAASQQDITSFQRLLQINPHRELVNIDPKQYDNYSTLLSFEKKNEQMTSADYLETQGLLLTLFSRFILEENLLPANNSLSTQKITETITYINEHLSEELSVRELAQRCHMHEDYYSREFKNLLGIRPLKYIQSQRIQRAQLLLATTTHSVPEIGSRIGLSNVSYFCRLFKRMSGITPGEFRKQQWKF